MPYENAVPRSPAEIAAPSQRTSIFVLGADSPASLAGRRGSPSTTAGAPNASSPCFHDDAAGVGPGADEGPGGAPPHARPTRPPPPRRQPRPPLDPASPLSRPPEQ